MKKKPLVRVMNVLSLLLLAGVTVWLCLIWGEIPSQVPLHYNAAGQIDRWGGKGTLIALAAIAWVMYGLLTLVERIPGAWNTGVKITEENRERVYALLGHLLSTLKGILCAMFVWILAAAARCQPLSVWFLPLALGAVFGDMLYWFVRVFRAR